MILRSWKQIADYLSTSVRSAQRCEAVHGMPVHRGAGSPRSSVFALTREIDEWLESVPVKQKPVEITAASPRVRSGSARLSTILAVDDNDVHLYALHKVLTAAGFAVVSARCGSEALRKTQQHEPDAIVLDVNLPDFNGFEVCRRIKAETRTAAIPIIFHSSTDCVEAHMQAQAAGATAFLSYPMHHQNMISMIKTCLAPALWPPQIDKFNFDTKSQLSS
jgi:CheY-like chemotaxis protein